MTSVEISDERSMQAQPAQVKGEFLLEVGGKTIAASIKNVTSAGGIRLETNDTGETRGKYDAARMETITVQIRPDGTCDWETKGFDMTREGGIVGFVASGKGNLTGQGSLTLASDVHFMTMVKDLRRLQTTRCWIEESINIPSGEFHRRVYAKK